MNIEAIKYNFSKLEMIYDLNIIQIANRKTLCKKEEPDILYLYIQNDGDKLEDRIDYLFDEEYEIFKFNVAIMEGTLKRSFEILSYEQVEEFELNVDSLYDKFINNELVEETICILGPKPPSLYGYDMNNPYYKDLKTKIYNKVEDLIKVGYTTILTNGYIGTEVIGYDVAVEIKKKYPHVNNILATPFLNLSDKWVGKDKDKYRQMMNDADCFVEIDKIQYYKYGQPEVYTKEKLYTKKDDFDIDHSNIFILVNPSKENDEYMNTIKKIKKHIGVYEKPVIEIDSKITFTS